MKKKSDTSLDNMLKAISEATVTGAGNTGTGILTGDAWPDGIYVKAGRRKILSPSGLMRGMTQMEFPLADAIYDNPEEYAGDLRDDTPPLSPTQRTWRGTGPNQYQIPPESLNGTHLANGKEDGWWWAGHTSPTSAPEQGTPEKSGRDGDKFTSDYLRVQDKNTSIHKLDKHKRYHAGTYVKSQSPVKKYTDRTNFNKSKLKNQPKDWWNLKGSGPMQDGTIKLKDLI